MSNDNDTPEAIARVSAIWYAFGRQDANYNPLVDVFAFATFYVEQRATRGQSIQDAFATYVAGLSQPTLADVQTRTFGICQHCDRRVRCDERGCLVNLDGSGICTGPDYKHELV